MSTEKPSPTSTVEPASTDPVDQVIRYHIQTKHHFNRYARSTGFLDWANQPDPFRRFAGAELIPLPLLKPDEEPQSPAYDAIYRHGAVPSQPVTMCSLSRFFEFALGLSAWKKGGETEWDVVPKMQVSLSKLQHILLSVGVRVPINQRDERKPQVLTYFLWDWFDGGLFQFWK